MMCYFNIAPPLINFSHCSTLELMQTKCLSESIAFHTTPARFTIQAAANGSVTVYGSFSHQHPNSITADFIMEDSETLSYSVGKENMFLSLFYFDSETTTLFFSNEDIINVGEGFLLSSLHALCSCCLFRVDSRSISSYS